MNTNMWLRSTGVGPCGLFIVDSRGLLWQPSLLGAKVLMMADNGGRNVQGR